MHVSFKSRKKTYVSTVLRQQQNVTRIKLGPGTYQLFLLPGMECASTHIRLCIQLKSGKKKFFFYFLKAFLSLISGQEISFILLLIKRSKMDPNAKPQTLVETFDLASSNSVPEYM